MASPTASTGSARRAGRSTSEVLLPPSPADQTIPTGGHIVWTVDDGIASTTPTGGFKMLILKDIDPQGHYNVVPSRNDPPALPALAATDVAPLAPMPEDVPEPVTLIILLGDLQFHHQHSPEEPPTPFLEGEPEEESDEGEFEVDAAGFTSGPPEKVTEGNVVTLGPVDKGAGVELIFGSVLEAHVPGSLAK